MKTSPLVRALVVVVLLAVGLGSLLGCGVTLQELRERNPQAKTLQVPCHPWQVRENVKVLAVRVSSNEVDHIVTDETPGELIDYAQDASVFIEIDASAPRENAQTMASEYGLVCEQDLPVRSAPLEALREQKPCSMQANAAASRQLMGSPNSQPCAQGAGDSGTTGAGAGAAALPRIGVCAHADGISSNEWYGGKGITSDVKTPAEHEAQVAKASVIFFFDKSAPPESVWYFGPKTKARCLGKPPIPYDQWVAQNSGTSTQQSGSGNSGTSSQQAGSGSSGTGTAGTSASAAPKKGNEKTTDTSSPTGQGPPLSFFEQLSRNMSLAGALAQGDTSGNSKDPNGHRNGIPSGTNVSGWSFPPLQAGVSLFQIISAIGLKPKELVDKIAAATKRGQRVIISEVDKDALKMVDQLIKDTSQYELAKGFQEVGSVMPFSMGQKVTKGLGSKFQAHKIFERQAFRYYEGILAKDGLENALAKAPSVILTDAEHQVITNELNDFWRDVAKKKILKEDVKKKLIEKYQKVYKDHLHWLQSIQHLLIQLP